MFLLVVAVAPGAQAQAPWLGLAYNSDPGAASLGTFVARGIVYDRSGAVEPGDGELATPGSYFGIGLRQSLAAGMVPDVEIDSTEGAHDCPNNPNHSGVCVPATAADITAYVHGFVATAESVLRVAGSRPVLFEPLDEPWNWASPSGDTGAAGAAAYANLLAALLPAVAAAQDPPIPASDILVAGTGRLDDGTDWIPDLYRVQPCLAAGVGPCQSGAEATPIAGWSIHAYGRPGRTDEGIGRVPVLRAQMRSGQDNIVVSEIGFCATDIGGGGRGCGQNQADIDGPAAQTATWLWQSLSDAAGMHQEGWLRALLIWARDYSYEPDGTGWAMQFPDTSLTPAGLALAEFATRYGDAPPSPVPPLLSGGLEPPLAGAEMERYGLGANGALWGWWWTNSIDDAFLPVTVRP